MTICKSHFRFDSGDLIGRHASILQGTPRGEMDHPFAKISEELTLHGNWAGELECCKKDGTTFPCLVHARKMDLPGKVYRVFALQELTGLPRA